ncbi:hypothetical protein Fmac_021466 [Flemingia macrophylla]|uniref:Uncharacterized protein n=1 Tax=Flemingia macrophylla TaxID=520843 RepID=A0ABD1LWX9_9FABA
MLEYILVGNSLPKSFMRLAKSSSLPNKFCSVPLNLSSFTSSALSINESMKEMNEQHSYLC